MSATPQTLLQKLQALPPQRRAEVEDFIDFLAARSYGDRSLAQAAQAASEQVLQSIWDNPADADYDRL